MQGQALLPGGCTVYPRWRGEHMALLKLMQIVAGLSPLARGTFLKPQIPPINFRFIPAGAGNIMERG